MLADKSRKQTEISMFFLRKYTEMVAAFGGQNIVFRIGKIPRYKHHLNHTSM
jgi:hypothetical protein